MRTLAATCLYLTLVPVAIQASTIRVPADYVLIQDALDVARPGDTVLVGPGTYDGPGNTDLDFAGKDLVLVSETGAPSTVILGTGPYNHGPRGIAFTNGESPDAVVDGFTFRDLTANDFGGAIVCSRASPTIRNCVFDFCVADGDGGAIYLEDSSSRIEGCTFVQNWGTSIGGGVCAISSSPVIERCRFDDNGTDYSGGQFYLSGSTVLIVDCVVTEGGDSGSNGGGLYASASDVTIEGTVFRHNAGYMPFGVRDGTMIIRSSTFIFNESGALHAAHGIAAGGDAQVRIERTILAFGAYGVPFTCHNEATIEFVCSDVFGNSGGNWVDCVAGQLGVDGNIESNPLFCNVDADVTIDASSPCAPAQSECGRIGAGDVACGVTPVDESTWGAIKDTFRRLRSQRF